MKTEINDLKQLQVTLHFDNHNYDMILNVDELKNSGSILFLNEGFEIKRIKKQVDSYGIEFVSKKDGDYITSSLSIIADNPESIIILRIGKVSFKATIYHETSSFINYFLSELKVPTIK